GATALMLAARGAHVVVADLNLGGAVELAAQIESEFGPRRALAVRTDVTSEDAIAELTRRTVLAYGGLDILVASAGLATSASLTETTPEEGELNFAVLAPGYFPPARRGLPVMAPPAAGGRSAFVAPESA